jgi:hypothetical protein
VLTEACRHDNIDGQAQKQYLARAPDRNPFGSGEHPAKFQDFDIFTKVCMLLYDNWAEGTGRRVAHDKSADCSSPAVHPVVNDTSGQASRKNGGATRH